MRMMQFFTAMLFTVAVHQPLTAQEANTEASEAAPTPVPDDADPVTIIVERDREIEKKEARDAVRDIAMRGRNFLEPNAQYQLPLCASVVGLGEEHNARVKDRIDHNTREAGFFTGAADCTVNALVVVVDDREALIENLRDTQPGLFDADISRRIRAALRRDDAAVSWASYQQNGPKGKSLNQAIGIPGIAGLPGISESAGANIPRTRSGGMSKFLIPFSIEKIFTVIIFDVRRLPGVHLDQLADFSTMRILADPQPSVKMDGGSADSILTLFDGPADEAPEGLTQIDRAFLKGLYALRPNDGASRLESAALNALENIRGEDCAAGEPETCR